MATAETEAPAHSESRRQQLLPRAYGRARLPSTLHRAAHGCARKMPDPLPTRLRSALTPSLTNREHRVHGSTTTVPGLWHARHGLPFTVTFLTETSGRDFFDMSNVRTCPFHSRTLGSETPTEPSSHLPIVGDMRHRAIGVLSNLAPIPPGADPARAALRSKGTSLYGRLPNVEPGNRVSRRPDMKSATSVLEESLPRRRMRRSVAVRIRELHGRTITVIAHQARLVVSLAVLFVTIGTYSAAARADEATYELGSVRDAMPASTGGRQEPIRYESLSSQGVHLAQAPAPVSASSETQVTAEQLAAEREFWASVKASEDPADIRAYLEQFPGGMFEALARNWLKRLEKAAQPQAAQVTTAPAVPTQEAAPAPSSSQESVEEALRLTRAQRMLVQRGLTALGFDVGAVDGIFGARTRAGIGKWQSSLGEAVTGFLDAGAAERLLKAGETVPPEPQRTVVRETMELLSEALSIARSIESASYRVRALSAIAEAQASAGDTRGAQRTISEALPIARSLGSADRSVLLSDIAEAQASAGDIQSALAIARSLESASSRSGLLGIIAKAQASAGDTRGAQRTIFEALPIARSLDIDNEYFRAEALTPIAEAQARTGDIPGALAIARSVDDAYSRAMALGAIVQSKFGRTQQRHDDKSVSSIATRPSSTQNQQPTKAASGSSLWGAFVLSSDHSGQSRRMIYAVAGNYPSRKAAIAAAADNCATKARRGKCGGGRVYYSEDTGYVTYVAFSTTSPRHDLSTLNNQDNSDLTHLFTGMDGDQRGKSIVLRRRCALVWSELDTTADYPNTPVVVFADSESRARAEFRSVWSKSANVSENWRNELTIYCNDQ